MKEDDAVESFFREMKKADENVAVPEFPKQVKFTRSRQLPVFLYAAAALAAIILVSVFFIYKTEIEEKPEQVFTHINEDEMNTNSLIEEKSLSDWDSPTSYLSEDF